MLSSRLEEELADIVAERGQRETVAIWPGK
jgi:hypothetical protein